MSFGVGLPDIFIEGAGAGQGSAASGVVSDILNLGERIEATLPRWVGNATEESDTLTIRKIDEVETRFYIRLMLVDKPGVLSAIFNIFGQYNISIASVTQKIENKLSAVPVVMLTHHVKERLLKEALEQLDLLPVVKGKPVAIRMEKL